MKARLYLCADDFAMSPGISTGILKLLDIRRLTATSCMTDSPHWNDYGKVLRVSYPQCHTGLHLNFSHRFSEASLPAYSITSLMLRAVCKCLDQGSITTSLHRQLDSFECVMQRPPHFIDGHQHVHLLPGIRDVVVRTLTQRYPSQHIAMRDVTNQSASARRSPKAMVLRLLGMGFTPLLLSAHIPHNTYFGGLYNLLPSSDFPSLMKTWLSDSPDQALIMCHPGLADSHTRVPHPACRTREFSYLSSTEFQDDLDAAACELAFNSTLPF